MAKGKTKAPPVPRGNFSRINYLYQASHLLARTPAASLSNYYLSQAKSVARKAVLRIDPSIKRTICKKCDELLFPGATAVVRLENQSKGGKKPWADVLVVECLKCGMPKRFPVGRKTEYTLWSDKGAPVPDEEPAAPVVNTNTKKNQNANKKKQQGKGKKQEEGTPADIPNSSDISQTTTAMQEGISYLLFHLLCANEPRFLLQPIIKANLYLQ